LDDSSVDALVTSRDGGVSTGPYASLNLALHVGDDPTAVLENRRRASASLGATLEDMVVAEQVHGDRVAVVGATDRGRGARSLGEAVPGADALVTTEPGLVLCVLVADCAPVVLVDPRAGVLGCAHAGWRGALNGVLETTIGSMTSLGARPDEMMAGIGPTIAGHRYEVGEEVAQAAQRRLGSTTTLIRASSPGHWWFDLSGTVGTILRRAGLPENSISIAGADTGPPGPYFSARAEGRCGRFALLARLRP